MKGSIEVPSPPGFGGGSPVPRNLPLQIASPGGAFWPFSAGKGQGKIKPFTVHIVNACLETSKLLKTLKCAVTRTLKCALKCAVTWTGFKIRHCTVRNPASSGPVLNLPSLQKVVWKEDASQNQHLSSSNFWISILQASGWLLEGKENIIYCGQWSPWGSGRKPAVHPDVAAQPAAASALKVFREWSCFCLPWSPGRYHKIGVVSLESKISKKIRCIVSCITELLWFSACTQVLFLCTNFITVALG